MKKLFTLTRVALTLLLFMAGFNQASAGATWVGNSAINVNGIWYYCGTELDWCAGGAFNSATIGPLMTLEIGAQSQIAGKNSEDWKSGTLIMHYKIDNGDWNEHALNYESYGHGQYYNNMRFQSGGGNFTAQTINISSLLAGNHTLSIYFGPIDGCSDGNSGSCYTATFTIPSAQTVSAGANGVATYSFATPLDFSTATTITPYVVSELSATSATLTAVKQAVPANTGLIIKGAKNASESISPVAEGTSVGTNYLQASVTATTVGDDEVYVLSSGVFHPATAGTIPANKAYLKAEDIPSGARSLNLVFDETTGISTTQMANDLLSKDFFNLAGQRVAQPTKGFYIVNGKKVIIK